MQMRVAIQLFGHLRSFERTASHFLENVVKNNVRNGIAVDVFIHTWDEFDSVQKTPSQYDRNEAFAGLKIPDIIRARVNKLYKPADMLIESQIPLTDAQIQKATSLDLKIQYVEVFRNAAHTFCQANRLRQEYETSRGIKYDLVIVTRPDILFYRPLDLLPFFKREKCWQFFDETSLQSFVFSTYINGAHAVIRPDYYVAGLDLVMLATPSACDKLARWEGLFDKMLNRWPEYALMDMINQNGLKHAYFVYEKDKFWTILRMHTKKQSFINKIADFIYIRMIPLLLVSNLYSRHTYTNVTTMVSLTDYYRYLREHFEINMPLLWRLRYIFGREKGGISRIIKRYISS